MTYSEREIRTLLNEQVIEDALETGAIEIRANGYDEIEVCFPHDDDPCCQNYYITLNMSEEEWDELDDSQKANTIIDWMCEMLDQDPNDYAEDIALYVNIILGVA